MANLRLEKTCPSCGANTPRIVERKALVTMLVECPTCFLRYRLPKDDAISAHQFYQKAYTQGFTTDLPAEAELTKLLDTKFAGHEKDFSGYIKLFQAAGLPAGGVVFDFGTSWGYGAWQFKQAGYRVYASEIGEARAEFAKNRLGVQIVPDPASPPEKIDLYFSSHVMEHLPDDNIIWAAAQSAVKPGGVFLSVMPNGDPARMAVHPDTYSKHWGMVHPLMHTSKHFEYMANKYGFSLCVLSDPYDLQLVESFTNGKLEGPEICMIAKKIA